MSLISDEHRQRFLLWLCTPPAERDPRSQEKLAEEFGYSPGSTALSKLKKDPEFLREWNELYLKTISAPDKKLGIMAVLEQTALDCDDPKHVQAAKAYFEIEGSLRPAGTTNVNVEPAKPVSGLSDEELEKLLSAGALDELAVRRELKEAAGE